MNWAALIKAVLITLFLFFLGFLGIFLSFVGYPHVVLFAILLLTFCLIVKAVYEDLNK